MPTLAPINAYFGADADSDTDIDAVVVADSDADTDASITWPQRVPPGHSLQLTAQKP
jgi:hypothetical protein